MNNQLESKKINADIPVITLLNCLDARPRHRGVNRSNLIDVPCQRNVSTCKSELLRFSLANCRSVRNKTSSILDYVSQDCKPDIFAITETWLEKRGDAFRVRNYAPMVTNYLTIHMEIAVEEEQPYHIRISLCKESGRWL